MESAYGELYAGLYNKVLSSLQVHEECLRRGCYPSPLNYRVMSIFSTTIQQPYNHHTNVTVY